MANNDTKDTTKSPDEPTEEQKKAAQAEAPVCMTPDSVFYVDVLVFLEGVQVPHNGVSVSYGVDGVATASITLPAAQFLRYLPTSTKVLVCFKDLCRKTSEKTEQYRVLFEGEIETVQYDITPSGANLVISASSVVAYLQYMQLTMQPVTNVIYNHAANNIGEAVFLSVNDSMNKFTCDMLTKMITNDCIKTTADLAYRIVKIMLAFGVVNSSQAVLPKFFFNKIGPTTLGYNILARFFNVSPQARAAGVDLSTVASQYNELTLKGVATNVSNGNGTADTYLSGNGTTATGSDDTSKYPSRGTITELDPKSAYIWPVRGYPPISSDYGAARSGGRTHKGIDIAVDENTNVISPADGTVRAIYWDKNGGGGNSLEITHTNGYVSQFHHLYGVKKGIVEGTTVKKGQEVALSGNTGWASTGPHLHWSVWPAASPYDFESPYQFLLEKTDKPTGENKDNSVPPQPVEPLKPPADIDDNNTGEKSTEKKDNSGGTF